MKVEAFLERIPSDFFTGVPDSQLKALCDALMERYGISERHIIAANEGNAVALATGHFLASGQVPTVYPKQRRRQCHESSRFFMREGGLCDSASPCHRLPRGAGRKG